VRRRRRDEDETRQVKLTVGYDMSHAIHLPVPEGRAVVPESEAADDEDDDEDEIDYEPRG
jgi:hypothetical protein